MRHSTLQLCAFMLLCSCNSAQAALNEQSQQEVDALLAFVESSGCAFIRNGDEHSPQDARAHLQKKLDYLNDKDLVDSAEDFIDRAATESSLSGEPYQVNCQGQRQPSADWLKHELQRLRQSNH
ncbi:hypothetical protein A9179_08410 [Pseudomonas alcaligenes]|uniref:DUF5329 domain-containing protein n=1 Tax=Aquipseudomonas alcaligenes TaxID=43263 RepID=A0ABR7S0F9_AQUAC|nr:DUF5329 domain-containing protein [Pseudomonas alcaligenes]MBC9250290.1 hypothetical protein [Pseudomonas alcaligenes]